MLVVGSLDWELYCHCVVALSGVALVTCRWAVNLVIRDACHAASSFQTLVLQGRSLLVFSTENRLRTFLFWLVKNAYFEALVLALIIFNCVLLAMDNPSVTDGSTLRLVRWRRERMASGSPCHKRVPVGNHGTDLLCLRCVSVPPRDQILDKSDVAFAAFFAFEMVSKQIAWGLWFCGESSYFRSNWNRLDAFVVIISLTAIAVPQVQVLRSFRALRPLRIIVRSKKIQVSC